MSTYTVARGGMTMPQALAAAARNPGADVIDVQVPTLRHFAVTDSGGLTIRLHDAKIDAAGFEYAIRITAPWTTIQGGEVFGASGSGIIVQRTHHVTIDGTRSHDNDGHGVYAHRSDWLTLRGVEADHNRVDGVSIHYAEDVPGPWAQPWAKIKLIGLDVHDNGIGGPATERHGVILDGKAQGASDWTSYAGRILVQDCASYDNAGTGLLDYGYKRVVVDGSEFHGNGTALSGTYATQFEVRGPADEFVFRHSSAIGERDGYTGTIRGPKPLKLTWDDNDFVWVGHQGNGVIAVGADHQMPPEEPQAPAWAMAPSEHDAALHFNDGIL